MQKKTFQFDKLVRDLIVDRMIKNGTDVRMKPLNDPKDLMLYFKKKLLEEAHEVQASQTVGELTEELADVLEVIDGICEHLKIDLTAIQQVQKEKKFKNGGFLKKLIVDVVTVEPANPYYEYYQQNTASYPEVDGSS